MRIRVNPGRPLRGEIFLPGDKSISHRAALFAALAEGESRVENFLVAGVTRAMLKAVEACGLRWELKGTTLTVFGGGLRGWQPPSQPIDCGNSATTMRLLAGAMLAAGIPATLDGSESLRRRPMDRIIQPLQAMGAAIHSRDGRAPLVIEPPSDRLVAINYILPVASAQVKTCLLLAGMQADGITTLREPGPSRDHTERLLRSLGLPVEQGVQMGVQGEPEYVTRLGGREHLSLPALNLTLPGDISAASFLIVAALITPGSRLVLKDILLNPTRTGLLDALEGMGALIQRIVVEERGGEPVGDLIVNHSRLKGATVSGSLVVRMIDEFPAFAVACAFADGHSVVQDAEELRYKESDRIAAICAELRSLGCPASETPDGFIINGDGLPSGGSAQAHGDHRLAMAMALVGLASKNPVEVLGAEIVRESFPGFVESLQKLGGRVEVEA